VIETLGRHRVCSGPLTHIYLIAAVEGEAGGSNDPGAPTEEGIAAPAAAEGITTAGMSVV
jgi:hypothetical protein